MYRPFIHYVYVLFHVWDCGVFHVIRKKLNLSIKETMEEKKYNKSL